MSQDWFENVPDASTSSRPAPTKGPLYFLIGAVVVLLIAVVVLVFTQVINTGKSIAEKPSAQASSAESRTSGAPVDEAESDTESHDTTPAEDPATDPATIAMIASETMCETDSSDGPAIIGYASDVISADLWDADHQGAIIDALKNIDKSCERDYVLTLQDELTNTTSPPQLNSLVANRSWIEPVRPAPDGAIEVGAFTTPAKNIQCGIEDGTLECSIYTYSYPSPEGCEGFTATYALRETGGVDAGCEYALKTDNVLDYGTVVASEGLVCELDEDGVTCWSELSGHGFTLTRARDDIF